jgi:hypothetical protein
MTNTNTNTAAIDLSAHASTSGKIRALHALGYSRSQIEKILKEQGVTTKNGDSIRYQHIRNVLITPLTSK